MERWLQSLRSVDAMKIVCATDFTQRSQAAAQVAVDLARRTGAEVELVHVMKPGTVDILALSADAVILEEEVRADVEAKLAAECDRLATSAAVRVTFHVCEGEVEAAVLARGREIGADLIVTATHGRSALRRILLGSVGEEIARRAERPILVVPPAVEGLASPFGRDKKLKILVALDGRGASAGAVDFVSALRAHVACDVTFLRLYWAMEEFERLGLSGPRDLFAPDAEVVADLERALRLEVGVLPGAGLTSFVIEPAWGDPATKILELARRRGEDLVVVGAESRHGFARLSHPAVAERIAHDASRVPVVFVPAKPAVEAKATAPAVLTVLAPTDLSAVGNRAVPYAYSLLGGHGGVVELCYVHERLLDAPAYVYEQSEGKLTDIERARVEADLRALIPADAREHGITTHVTVVDGGRAADAILQAAERLVVDEIVLGSHGRGGAARSLLGSVSRAVVEQSRRPVLVVPSKRQ
jgi:nucleotide-binding universal stress UspA family protein